MWNVAAVLSLAPDPTVMFVGRSGCNIRLGGCKFATITFVLSRITTEETTLWDTALIKSLSASP
jgi:hypothetical protein